MEQLFHGFKPISNPNLSNGYIEVQCSWEKQFDGTYILIAKWAYHGKLGRCRNIGARDVSSSGFIQCVGWDRSDPPGIDEQIEVWGQGIQDDPEPPGNLTGTLNQKLVTLNWTSSNQQVYYNVFRGDKPGGPYQGFGTHISGLTWSQTVNLKGTYYYVTQCVNLENPKLVSGFSNEVQVVV